MDFTTLGRTGLKVSVAGLGCGGSSCLGQTSGQSIDYSVGIIQRALDLGVNYIDTARHYGTEEVIGALLQHVPRDTFTLATKAHHRKGDTSGSIIKSHKDRLHRCVSAAFHTPR
jgi:L-galactose dehydrogenase